MDRAAPRLLRRSALAVVAVVLALLAVGCSWLQPSNRSLAGPAPSMLSATPSATPSASQAVAPPTLDAQAAERQSAAARTVSVSFREQIRGAVRATVSGQVLVQRTPLRISEQLTVTVAGRTAQLSAIINRRAMYLQASLTPGAPESWIKVPLSQLGLSTRIYDVQNEDPMSQVSLLQASDHLRLEGPQTVDGVPTSKYAGYLTPAAALADMPSAERAQLAPIASQITGDIHFVLWIGPGEQVKKIRMAETVAGSKVTLTYVVNWLNRPVHIAIPHAAGAASLPAGVVETAA